MFDGWLSYKHMQSTEACVDHVKLSLCKHCSSEQG